MTDLTRRYAVFVIPTAHRLAGNIWMALVNGDNPAVSNSFSRGANADGSYADPEDPFATATYFFAGMPVSADKLAMLSGLADDMVQPEGGWPLLGVTEAQAVAAAMALHLQVTVTQDGTPPDPLTTMNNAMAAKNVVPIVVEE